MQIWWGAKLIIRVQDCLFVSFSFKNIFNFDQLFFIYFEGLVGNKICLIEHLVHIYILPHCEELLEPAEDVVSLSPHFEQVFCPTIS